MDHEYKNKITGKIEKTKKTDKMWKEDTVANLYVAEISTRLVRLQTITHNIFVHKPRSLDLLDRRKANRILSIHITWGRPY